MALTFNPCTWDERQIDLGVFQVSLVYIHKENRINRQIKLFFKYCIVIHYSQFPKFLTLKITFLSQLIKQRDSKNLFANFISKNQCKVEAVKDKRQCFISVCK